MCQFIQCGRTLFLFLQNFLSLPRFDKCHKKPQISSSFHLSFISPLVSILKKHTAQARKRQNDTKIRENLATKNLWLYSNWPLDVWNFMNEIWKQRSNHRSNGRGFSMKCFYHPSSVEVFVKKISTGKYRLSACHKSRDLGSSFNSSNEQDWTITTRLRNVEQTTDYITLTMIDSSSHMKCGNNLLRSQKDVSTHLLWPVFSSLNWTTRAVEAKKSTQNPIHENFPSFFSIHIDAVRIAMLFKLNVTWS